MQDQTSHGHTPHHPRATALLPLAGLLILLALLGLWGTARAAQQSGTNNPNLNIVSLNNNVITLAGQNWEANSTVTLSYSTSTKCQPATALKSPNNIAFVDAQGTFQVAYPWPASITGGPFYFCANGRGADHTSAPGIYTPQAIVVSPGGSVSFAPGSAPTPKPTFTPTITPTATNTPGNSATATAQAATATAQATQNATPTATQVGTPGNKGANASNKPATSIAVTLVAIFGLCFLVLLLLIYLVRVWLHGRKTP